MIVPFLPDAHGGKRAQKNAKLEKPGKVKSLKLENLAKTSYETLIMPYTKPL